MATLLKQLQFSLIDWIINTSFLVLPVMIAVVVLIFTLKRKQIKLKELPEKAKNVYAFIVILSVDFVYLILVSIASFFIIILWKNKVIVLSQI